VFPVYALAKELYPGKYRPTVSHAFVSLLADKNRLGMCFTQNIDTLERRAGVPAQKVVEAHGSFATQRCIDCDKEYDGAKMKKAVFDGAIPRCERCNGLVKPDIVFFGEAVRLHFLVRGNCRTTRTLILFYLFPTSSPLFSTNHFSSSFRRTY